MSEPQDWAEREALEIVERTRTRTNMKAGECADRALRGMIAYALRAAHASGRRAGLLEAANECDPGDGGMCSLAEEGWGNIFSGRIRALAGAPPREDGT